MMKVPDGTVRILVQCGQRVELGDFVSTTPYLVARITEAPDELEPSPELEGLRRNVQATFSRIIEELPYLPEELQLAVANIDDPAGAGPPDRGRAQDRRPRRSSACSRSAT